MTDHSNTDRRRRASRHSAFTLIEVLLVLVILVVLASMVVTMFGGTQEGAYKKAAAVDVGNFKSAIYLYKFHTKSYPSSLNDLATKPGDSTIASHWEGPYLERVQKDPWDHDYHYAQPGKHNSDTFDVWSSGPNGQDGDADDIGNWEQ